MKALATALWLALVTVLSMAPKVHAGATVLRDVEVCAMLDGNGEVVFTLDSQVVINTNGNVKKTCHANVTPSASGQVLWDFSNTGFTCPTPAGPTTIWHEVVSAQG